MECEKSGDETSARNDELNSNHSNRGIYLRPIHLAKIPLQPLDVTRDGSVTPLDALRVINAIGRSDGAVSDPADSFGNFIDVNGDFQGTPIDALLVINALARQVPLIAATLPNDSGPDGLEDFALDLVTNDYSLDLHVSVGELSGTTVRLRIGGTGSFFDISSEFSDGMAHLTTDKIDGVFGSPLPDGDHLFEVQVGESAAIDFLVTVDRETSALGDVDLELPFSPSLATDEIFEGREARLLVDLGNLAESVVPELILDDAVVTIQRVDSSGIYFNVPLTPATNQLGGEGEDTRSRTLTVRFTDQAGNQVYTKDFLISVVPDTTPPSIIGTNLDRGVISTGEYVVSIEFDEPMVLDDLPRLSVRTAEGVEIPSTQIQSLNEGRMLQHTFRFEEAGVFELTAEVEDFQDSAGNILDVFPAFQIQVAAQSPAIFPARRFATGANPYSMVSADFNGDGFIDLVTANTGGGNVSIHYGSSGGLFGDPQNIPVGWLPVDLTVGDLNLDGLQDIVTANASANSITVLLAAESGEFERVDYASAERPGGLTVADFNGDRIPDVATVSRQEGVSVHFGTGDGQLSTQLLKISDVGLRPTSIKSADFNEDGSVDIVVGGEGGGGIAVLFTTATGEFLPAVQYADGTHGKIAVGDFNGDQRLDIATASRGDASATIFINNLNGTFSRQQQIGIGAGAGGIGVADLDLDGHDDLVIGDFDYGWHPDNALHRGAVIVVRGNGDGTFDQPLRISANHGPDAIVIYDVDGNGFPDIATAGRDSDELTTILNQGGFKFESQHILATGVGPSGLVAADFNGDGIKDLVSANETAGTVSVLLADPEGSQTNNTTVFKPQAVYNAFGNPRSIAYGDFTGDGNLDVVTANPLTGTVSLLRGDGGGGFASTWTFTTGEGPLVVGVADVNGDSVMDFVVANTEADSLKVFTGPIAETSTATYSLSFPNPGPLSLGDYNGDGMSDILVVDTQQSEAGLFLATRGGGFADAMPISVSASSSISHLTSDDFDDSGTLDFVVADDSGRVFQLKNLGDGHFSEAIEIVRVSSLSFLNSGDVNGDGIIDLVSGDIALGRNSSVDVYLGNGLGSFSNPQKYGVGTTPVSSVLDDLNQDGLIDLVAVNRDSNDISILWNQLNGMGGTTTLKDPYSFNGASSIFEADHPANAITVDVNGDTIEDVVVAVQDREALSIRMGSPDGAFSSPLEIPVDGQPGMMDANDLNGDGNIDLVVSLDNRDDVSLLFGDGSGTFSKHTLHVGQTQRMLSTDDINGDGVSDIIIANYITGIWIFINEGDGSFATGYQLPSVDHVLSFKILDLNNDSRNDLVVGSDGRLLVYQASNDGTLERTALIYTGESFGFASIVTAADFDGDNVVDIAIADVLRSRIKIYYGLGEGLFDEAHFYVLANGYMSDLVAGDFNGDGLADLAASSQQDSFVTIMIANQDRTFSVSQVDNLSAVTDLALGDFDRDGRSDLLAVQPALGTVKLLFSDFELKGPSIQYSGAAAFASVYTPRVRNRPDYFEGGDFSESDTGRIDRTHASRATDRFGRGRGTVVDDGQSGFLMIGEATGGRGDSTIGSALAFTSFTNDSAVPKTVRIGAEYLEVKYNGGGGRLQAGLAVFDAAQFLDAMEQYSQAALDFVDRNVTLNEPQPRVRPENVFEVAFGKFEELTPVGFDAVGAGIRRYDRPVDYRLLEDNQLSTEFFTIDPGESIVVMGVLSTKVRLRCSISGYCGAAIFGQLKFRRDWIQDESGNVVDLAPGMVFE